MLQTIGFTLLYRAVILILTKELFIQVYESVVAAASLELTGAQKKAKVTKELADVKAVLKSNFGNFADSMLNLAIEIAYAKFNGM